MQPIALNREREEAMLRSRQKFQNMAVWVTKVNPPAALSGVQLPILETPGFTSIRNSGLLHALQDCIELIIANVKSVVVVFKRFSVVEIKGQLLIDSDRSKVPRWAGILKTEDLREKTCGGLLVMRRHDSVIQPYTHDRLLWASRLPKKAIRCFDELTLRQAQGERSRHKPFVVRLSNHERQTPWSCYNLLVFTSGSFRTQILARIITKWKAAC